MTYQWYSNAVASTSGAQPVVTGGRISGATGPSLQIATLQNSDAAYYYVAVQTNGTGPVALSSFCQLTVNPSPGIVSQSPGGAFTLYQGQNQTLSVTVAGNGPFTYQWYTNGSPDTTAGLVSTYSLTSVTTAMNNEPFYCVVEDVNNNPATSITCTLTVTPISSLSSYGQAIMALNPNGYWPMHEAAAQAPGDIETNLGSLGALGNAYYGDWAGTNAVIINHQAAGALGSDPDPAAAFSTQPGSYLIVPHVSSLTTIKGPFSVECWVKPYNDLSYYCIVGQGGGSGLSGSGNYGGFDLQYSGTPNCFSMPVWSGSGTASYELKTGTTYPPGVWYHLVATFDGTNVAYYVDGQPASSGIVQSGAPGPMNPDSWSPLVIGAGRWGTGAASHNFDGEIDEVAIYTNVLASGRISQHYSDGTNTTVASGTYKADVLTDTPLLYYRMDAPAYHQPPTNTWPVLNNLGSVGKNGLYSPGTLVGALPGPSRSGQSLANLSGSVAFAGTGMGSYADAGADPTYFPYDYTNFSYTAWFKGYPADDRSFQGIMSANDGTWRASINSSGAIQAHGVADITSPNVIYNDGNWHLMTLVYSGNSSLKNGTNLLYVDGQLVITSTSTSTNSGVSSGGPEVFIGNEAGFTNNPVGPGRSLAGSVCEAAFFYGTALTSTQVTNLWNAAGVPPFITAQPVLASTNNQGSSYTNSVTANGSAIPDYQSVLGYQWYENGAGISGATNSVLIINPVQPSNNSSNYYVVITNTYGAVTSSVFSLTVNSAAVVNSQLPVTYTNLFTLYAGTNPKFSVLAGGAAPITYRWYTNSVLVPWATAGSMTLTNIQVGMLTNYCTVSNTVNITTSAVWIASVVADPSAPYPLAVLALQPISYWRLSEPDDNNSDGNPGALALDYAGGESGIYTNTALGQTPGYDNNYSDPETCARFGYWSTTNCAANNIQGIDFSAPTNTSVAFTVEAWVQGLGQITGNAGIVSKGTFFNEEFDLDCGGTSNGYRFEVRTANGGVNNANSTVSSGDALWHHLVGVCDEPHGALNLYIDGALAATTPILQYGGIQASNNTQPVYIGARPTSLTGGGNNQFYGYVNDVAIFNYALSSSQVLGEYTAVGNVAPYFTLAPPASTNVAGGQTLIIPAIAQGSPTLNYTWYDPNNNVLASGSTNQPVLNATLTVSNVPGGWNNGTLTLNVNNAGGSTNVSVALTVYTNAPIITVDLPPQVVVPAGRLYTYSPEVVGALPLAYQWYAGASAVGGATNATYGATAGSPGQTGTYSVIVTNLYGSATSVVSTLTAVAVPGYAYASTVLGLGPVGYWPLQETNTPAAATIETNYGSLGALGDAYYATTNGATYIQFDQPGLFADDLAVGFNGANGTVLPSYAFVPRISPALTLQPPLTLECWLYSSSTGFGDVIGEGGSGLNSPSGGGNAGGIRVSYAGNPTGGADVQVYIFNGVGITRPDIGTSGGPMALNTWNHCVATYDGTNATIYVNGVQQATGPLTMATDIWTPLTIGAGFWSSSAGPVRGYIGTEDEVAIYTNVLSAAHITQHYNDGIGGNESQYRTDVLTVDNALLYYRMDSAGYTNVPTANCPEAVNFGSAPVNGAYLSGTRPGFLAGPADPGQTGSVALPVNGQTACVDAGYDPTFDPTGHEPFTALLWFKGNPADGRLQTLMGHGTNWSLNLDGTTGYVDWDLYTGGQITSTSVLNDGNWHFVAGVYDGTNSYLYADGVLTTSATAAAAGLDGDTVNDLYLGGNANDVLLLNNQQYLAGSIAQAALFTNALTAAQIQALYSLPAPTISMARSGSGLVITYVGTLQGATNVRGPYLALTNTSPYTISTTNKQQYFRAMQP